MADRSVSVFLNANISGFTAGISKAKLQTIDFAKTAEKSATKHKESWDKVGKGMLLTGGVIAAGVGLAVKKFADFDAQMSQVKTLSHATGAEMAQLTKAALTLGQNIGFSATETADAETELVKAGVSVADIMGGALVGALNLAAAGQIKVGDATEIAAVAMTQFKLAGSDIPHVADLLAAGADKSLGGVEDLGMAMKQGGLVAAQFGLTVDQTVGTLSEFAAAGLMGSDAGTSMKQMFLSLASPSNKARAEMDKFGISAYDLQGNFVGVAGLAGQLHDSFEGVDAASRDAALSIIFGSDAVRAANILMKDGAKGNQDWTNSVNDQGFAAEQAKGKMDNLKGDVAKLGAAFENDLIKSGSGANDTLRSMTQHLTGLATAYGNLSPTAQSTILKFGAVGAAALLAGGIFVTLVPKIAATKLALAEMGVTARLSGSRLSEIAKGAGRAGAALAAVSIAGSALASNTGTNKAAESLSAYIKGGKDATGVTAEMTYGFNNLGSAVGYATKGGGIEGIARSLGDLTQIGNGPQQFFRQLDTAMAEFVRTGRQGDAAKIFDEISASAKRQGISMARVKDAMPEYQAALSAAKTTADGAAPATDAFSQTVARLAKQTRTATFDVTAFDGALKDLFGQTFSVEEATDAWHSSLNDLSDAVKTNGRSIEGTSAKAIANRDALRGAAQRAYDLVQAYADTGASAEQVTKKSAKLKAEFIKQAEKAGYSRKAAEKYADALDAIPGVVKSSVSVSGIAPAITAASRLRTALLKIPNRNVSVDVVVNTANKLAAQLPAGDNQKVHKAGGGYVSGPGTSTSDSIDASLSDGEYVMKAASVDKYGKAFFDGLNSMAFANGGLVHSPRFAAGGAVHAPYTSRGRFDTAQGAGGSPIFNAYGLDAEAAMQKAMRHWEFKQVPR